jgi:hypothetical protein
MHLAGFPLSAVLGVFGVAAAGTVVLYILKLRRRPVAVVFSPIWQRVLGARESSRLFSQLKRWLSLLLQLVLLALLALALGDPRLAARAAEATPAHRCRPPMCPVGDSALRTRRYRGCSPGSARQIACCSRRWMPR